MSTKYKCIQEFEVPRFDDDCGSTDDIMVVCEGTFWEIDDGYKLIGGEVRLISDNLSWLEINKETLDKYFKEVLND